MERPIVSIQDLLPHMAVWSTIIHHSLTRLATSTLDGHSLGTYMALQRAGTLPRTKIL